MNSAFQPQDRLKTSCILVCFVYGSSALTNTDVVMSQSLATASRF